MRSNPSGTAETPVRTPTVARTTADTLVELVYDPAKRRTALVVSRFDGLWNIEQEVAIGNEILVPYSAGNNLIAHGCVLLPSQPVEFGTKDELLGDIRTFIHRHVDLSPLFEEIAAHYVLLTWVHDAFGELPYLRLLGEFGTGKTRALMILGALCYRGFFASGASTVSPIFHTLDAFGGTLVLDEADLPYSDARVDLVKILNNGTVRGMPVLRTIQNRHKEFNPYAFKVFGPKIIAAREPFQDRALESRFVTEATGTRPLRADIPIHLPKTWHTEALALRNRLLHYRFCTFFKVAPDPSAIVAGIAPRLNQTALSLLSLVDDPALRARMQGYFRDRDAAAVAARREAPEARILAAVLALDAQHAGAALAVRDITGHVNAMRDAAPLSYRSVGEILRRRLHLATRKSNGVYVVADLDRSQLTALAHTYGLS